MHDKCDEDAVKVHGNDDLDDLQNIHEHQGRGKLKDVVNLYRDYCKIIGDDDDDLLGKVQTYVTLPLKEFDWGAV